MAMANPVCLSPLKFYDSISWQTHRRSYAYGHISPLILPLNKIPPFQFVVPSTIDLLIYLYRLDGSLEGSLEGTSGFISSFIENDNLIVMCIGGYMSGHPEGEYYLKIGNYYSEVFSWSSKLTNSIGDFIKLQYKNSTGSFNLKGGTVSFANNFEFELYLMSELGKPEYKFEEESTKRLGYDFIESQVSKKVYKFNTVIPEYICDALRIVRLCDTKKLTYKGQEYEMLSFDMDVDWQSQGDLASVTCEFETDNVIVNLGGFTPT